MVRIGITMGDPKGIGPEIVAKVWRVVKPELRSNLRIYGDKTVLDAAAKMAGIEFDPKQLVITSSTQWPVGNISDPDAARITLLSLDAAIADIKTNILNGIVTSPVSKRRLQLVDAKFIGHTELLAKAAGAKDVVMFFACLPMESSCEMEDKLRISLVTSHLAIQDVSAHLTKQRIFTTIKLTAEALQKHFGCDRPRIAVLSLNPHAGEAGSLGTEEEKIIKPAIERARKEGIICFGPISSEVIFSRIKNIDFDGVVAMYHDQGLSPMRIVCGQRAVNITLGLPFVRTSPGHGTAEDIAWRGQANEQGILAAISMAEHLVKSSI